MALEPDGAFGQCLDALSDLLYRSSSGIGEPVIGKRDHERKRNSSAGAPTETGPESSHIFDSSEQKDRHGRGHRQNRAAIDRPIEQAKPKGSEQPQQEQI